MGKQTSALAARLQQMFSRVRELEREGDREARPSRRADARRGDAGAGEGRSRRLSGTVGLASPGSYEVRLVRDDDARGAHARAMRRTLAANVAANDAIGLSDTFWAWMESVLALEEREELEGGDAGGGEDGEPLKAGAGDPAPDPGAPSLARALRDVQANVKTVADALRERRRPRARGEGVGRREGEGRRASGDGGGMAAAERRRSGSPDGDAGESSADAVERAATRASEELNARAAKAASALPRLAQIKDAVAAADAERAAGGGGRFGRARGFGRWGHARRERGVPAGGGGEARGARRVLRRRVLRRSVAVVVAEAWATVASCGFGGRDGCARAPFTGARGLGTSARRRSEPLARDFERRGGPSVRPRPPGVDARLGVRALLVPDL